MGKILEFIRDFNKIKCFNTDNCFDEDVSYNLSLKYDWSDIHIRENEYMFKRVNGDIEKTNIFIDKKDIEDFLFEIGKREFILKIKEKNDIDFSFKYKEFRYRGSFFIFCNKYGIVIRKICGEIKTIDELNLPQVLKKMCEYKNGLILITGPTGSGKSTTLAAMIEHINTTMKKHIITIEDPIEFIFLNKKCIISQREIGTDSIGFSDALKSSLRQDPDVIVIGEIRDRESLNIAMRASETGHLCICTLHTLGAVSTIERILDMYNSKEKEVARNQLSLVLRAIISQQLIKTKKQNRVGAFEIMINDRSSMNIIKEGRINQLNNYISTNRLKGMISMDSSLMNLYELNKISIEEVCLNCIDINYVKKKYKINNW